MERNLTNICSDEVVIVSFRRSICLFIKDDFSEGVTKKTVRTEIPKNRQLSLRPRTSRKRTLLECHRLIQSHHNYV